MIRKPEARPGFTLTEVLIAMFVMAIAMISLLVLFPVGFINARWALDTEQVSHGAANAQSLSEIPRVAIEPAPPGALPIVRGTAQSVRNDDNYRPETSNGNLCWQFCATVPPAAVAVGARLGRDSFLKSTANGAWTFNTNINAPRPVNALSLPALVPILTNSKVKYPPVFVDPFIADNPVFVNTVIQLPYHVGANAKDDLGLPSGNITPFAYNLNASVRLPVLFANTNPAFRPNWSVGIPRFSLSQYQRDMNAGGPAIAVNQRMQGETSMGDEVDFGPNGRPNITNNILGEFAAQRRFTWAYMCHWFDYATPEVCDVTAVVFNSRPTNGGLANFPPGEDSYLGFPAVALQAGIEGPATNFGRAFVKGLSQAALKLSSAEPIKAKVGDWILDNTMILPEYNVAFPLEKVPFLDEYHPQATYVTSAVPLRTLRPGLVGGHFYKILDISSMQNPSPGVYYQTITLDRPAKSDGFSACMIAGIADVIVKGVGRMPQR